jgi:hypothetical protein
VKKSFAEIKEINIDAGLNESFTKESGKYDNNDRKKGRKMNFRDNEDSFDRNFKHGKKNSKRNDRDFKRGNRDFKRGKNRFEDED